MEAPLEEALDQIRALAAGELAPEEAARVRRELERDEELWTFAEEYARLHALTAVLERDPPRCELEYAQLERRLEEAAPAPRRFPRRVAAAAVVLALAGASAPWWVSREREPALVELRAIAREAAADAAEVEIPLALASWRPVDGGDIRWLGSLEEARAAARAVGRPVLIFGTFPGCPTCERLKGTALRDEEVLSLAEEYVPVEVNLAAVGEEAARELMRGGYPVFEVQAEDGTPLANFSGDPPVERLRERMLDALAVRVDLPRALDWELVAELARLYGHAQRAEREGSYGAARGAYGELLELGGGRAFTEAGAHGLARIAADARATLLEALRVAGEEPEAAELLLERALERFEATPYEPDLARVLEELRSTGRPPRIEWARG